MGMVVCSLRVMLVEYYDFFLAMIGLEREVYVVVMLLWRYPVTKAVFMLLAYVFRYVNERMMPSCKQRSWF
ncbi:hypothetical protein L6164_001172 [Bauhinia variegata]|uniref:Uncharacterized protein n=1 Tax=Bauhinia variegata TaxID=167791 RepID=A0ACB9Q8X2_BAUVA|nr:hypothetical protein L6164_001172 [Bauhinia variegata]